MGEEYWVRLALEKDCVLIGPQLFFVVSILSIIFLTFFDFQFYPLIVRYELVKCLSSI